MDVGVVTETAEETELFINFGSRDVENVDRLGVWFPPFWEPPRNEIPTKWSLSDKNFKFA